MPNNDVTLEETDMASKNHSIIQFQLGAQLALGHKYKGATELSLDMTDKIRQDVMKKYGLAEVRELKPDIALYNADDLRYEDMEDEVRVLTPPLLCVEIVSPTQSALEVIKKFKVYFDIGVKSCWYIDPILKVVKVYKCVSDSTKVESDTFFKGNMRDDTLGIEIPLDKIFY